MKPVFNWVTELPRMPELQSQLCRWWEWGALDPPLWGGERQVEGLVMAATAPESGNQTYIVGGEVHPPARCPLKPPGAQPRMRRSGTVAAAASAHSNFWVTGVNLRSRRFARWAPLH